MMEASTHPLPFDPPAKNECNDRGGGHSSSLPNGHNASSDLHSNQYSVSETNLQGKNILITGGAGFIASWVTRHFASLYAGRYSITVFDNLDYAASVNNIRQLIESGQINFVQGDIRHASDLAACLDRFEIDTVLHFAAKSHVGTSFKEPFEFTSNNVTGTQVLLEECVKRKERIWRFFYCSTDEVYGEPASPEEAKDRPECSALRPMNPYSATKAAAEMIVFAYAKSYGLPILVMRPNNAYGPQQYPEKLIPRFTLRLLRNEDLPLHSSGARNLRRYVYAADLARAVDVILHRGAPGQAYNVASRDEMTNWDVARTLVRMWAARSGACVGGDASQVEYGAIRLVETDRPHDDGAYLACGENLGKLGWRQEVSLEEGLARTMEWYEKHGEGWWEDGAKQLEGAGSQMQDGQGQDERDGMLIKRGDDVVTVGLDEGLGSQMNGSQVNGGHGEWGFSGLEECENEGRLAGAAEANSHVPVHGDDKPGSQMQNGWHADTLDGLGEDKESDVPFKGETELKCPLTLDGEAVRA